MAKPGYVIPVAAQSTSAEGSTPPAVVAALPIEQRLAAADENKGQADVIPCQSCHNFEKGAGQVRSLALRCGWPRKGLGPSFEYSEAPKSEGGNWTSDLDLFLANPKAFAQDTKMAFAGESDQSAPTP
jgi:cytochrome c